MALLLLALALLLLLPTPSSFVPFMSAGFASSFFDSNCGGIDANPSCEVEEQRDSRAEALIQAHLHVVLARSLKCVQVQDHALVTFVVD